jgi:hypothetical protein
MLGIPLIPVHEFPVDAPVIFLPAQAAADPSLLAHITEARNRGAQLIITTNLLLASGHSAELARMIGISPDIRSKQTRAHLAGDVQGGDVIIDLESPIEGEAGPGNIVCTSGDKKLALLVINQTPRGRIALLNTHTYSQADFDAVWEVLLCPRPLGLLGMGGHALTALREAFGNGTSALSKLGIPTFDGPSCITFDPLGSPGTCVIQNFNEKPVNVTLTLQTDGAAPGRFVEALSGQAVPVRATKSEGYAALDVLIPARSRIWLRRSD